MLRHLVRQHTVNGELNVNKPDSPCQPRYDLLDGYQGIVVVSAQSDRRPTSGGQLPDILLLPTALAVPWRGVILNPHASQRKEVDSADS